VQVQQDVVAMILDSMTWRPAPAGQGSPGHKKAAIPLLVGGTVKQATTFLTQHVTEQRRRAWLEYASAARATQPLQPPPVLLPEHLYDEPQLAPDTQPATQQQQQHAQQQQLEHAVHHLSSTIKQVWRLPWHNCHKEILWRLAVRGVPWAGGHDIVPAQPCPCGWRVAVSSDTHDASLAWQEHCFWSCPVAQQVVAQLRRALPPAVLVSRAHVWLLLSPNELAVRPDVWVVVGLAALSAMHLGRKVLHAKSSQAAQQSQQSARDVQQPTLDEMWGFASLPDHEPPAGLDFVQQAASRAAAEFWALLQDFASVHDGYFEGPWWDKGKRQCLQPRHPFLAGCGSLGSIKVLIPPDTRLGDVE
jgi:hypothetical protein